MSLFKFNKINWSKKIFVTRVIILVVATSLSLPLWAEMDQDMQMQGGKAPADARDPHAYSDGYTLTAGPYSQAGPRQLKLADEHRFWSVLGDRLEYDPDNENTALDMQAWYGTTYNRFLLKLEADITDSHLEESQIDLLWGRAFTAYFDTQLGIRIEQYDEGQDRQWLAVGLKGLAPYWFELDITIYLRESGHTALTFESEYELLLTQKLILQPRVEMALYGKGDSENGLGSGLAEASLGLRLRYEITRQFAPYIGVEWSGAFGGTADAVKSTGNEAYDTYFVTGLRFWF